MYLKQCVVQLKFIFLKFFTYLDNNFSVDLQNSNQPSEQDIDDWLTWKDTYQRFVEDDNLDKYSKFLFRYTFPMTRNKIVDKVLADHRQGKLEFIPDILEKITPSDHAFALLSVMNHYKDWASKKDAFVSRDSGTMKKVRTKWTQAAARSRINTGWQPAALQAYRKCEGFFKNFMRNEEWILLRDRIAEMMEKKVQSDKHTRVARRERARGNNDENDKEPEAHEFDDFILEGFEEDGDSNEGRGEGSAGFSKKGRGCGRDDDADSIDEDDYDDDDGGEDDHDGGDNDGVDNEENSDNMRVEAV